MGVIVRTAYDEELDEVGELTARVYLDDGLLDHGEADGYVDELRDARRRAAHAEILVAVEAAGPADGAARTGGAAGGGPDGARGRREARGAREARGPRETRSATGARDSQETRGTAGAGGAGTGPAAGETRAAGRLLGALALAAHGSPYAEIAREHEGEFRMLAVRPEARGRGVGEMLVRACAQRCRERGLTGLALSTQDTMEAAHRLYGRLGFRRARDRDWEPLPGVTLRVFTLDLSTDL